MMRFTVATLLAAGLISGSAGAVSANRQTVESESYPVVGQLVLRDRHITITASPTGNLYVIADEEGTALGASLTEKQLAEQYPELFDLLQPAVAEGGSELMMLAPVIDY